MWTNSARYHLIPHSISPRLPVEEAKKSNRLFNVLWSFSSLLFSNSLCKIFVGFYFLLEIRVFVPRENSFQRNVKRDSLRCILRSASRLHLVWSYRKITPPKVRTIHKLSQRFGEMDRATENLVGFGDWWDVVKKGVSGGGGGSKGLARVSKSSLHDQTYGLFFILFLSLVILIFVSSFSFCSFIFVHPPSLFPIRLLLILLHPKYCENVTVYCK